jgi:hypothetical protein
MPAVTVFDRSIIGMIAENLIHRRNALPCHGYPPGALFVRGVTWMKDGRVTVSLAPKERIQSVVASRCPLAEFPPESPEFTYVIEDEESERRGLKPC